MTPESRQLPARRITNRGGKLISRVPTASGSVWAEGQLERDFLCLLAADHTVTEVTAQPVEIKYTYDRLSDAAWLGHCSKGERGAKDRILLTVCYPDFLVFRTGRRPWLVEVWGREPDDRLHRKALASRLYAEAQGYDFSILTADDIRTSELDRARLWARYARTVVPFAVKERAISAIERVNAPMSCRQLASAIGGEAAVALAFIFSLVAQRTLALVSGQCLTPDALVVLEGGARHG